MFLLLNSCLVTLIEDLVEAASSLVKAHITSELSAYGEIYTQLASAFFYFLEDVDLLDPDNILDLYVLHYVFLPVIQKQLDIFRETWARHSLRTERNRSPRQLWMIGHETATHEEQEEAVTGIDAVS